MDFRTSKQKQEQESVVDSSVDLSLIERVEKLEKDIAVIRSVIERLRNSDSIHHGVFR